MQLPYLEVDFHLMLQNTKHQPELCPLLLATVQSQVARETAEAATLTGLVSTPLYAKHTVAAFKVGGHGGVAHGDRPTMTPAFGEGGERGRCEGGTLRYRSPSPHIKHWLLKVGGVYQRG